MPVQDNVVALGWVTGRHSQSQRVEGMVKCPEEHTNEIMAAEAERVNLTPPTHFLSLTRKYVLGSSSFLFHLVIK